MCRVLQVPAQQPESSGEGAGHAVQPTLEDDVPQTYGGVTGTAYVTAFVRWLALLHLAECQTSENPQCKVTLMRRGSGNSCTGEDLDGPKTVEEKVSRLAKVRLLKQFSFGVIAYVLATALVVLLPIFVSPEVRFRHNECRAQ